MIKRSLIILGLCLSSIVFAGTGNSDVLLAPIEASKVGAFDWGVVVLPNPIPDRGSSADRGSLKVNLDLGKFFAEGYAIYSITKLDSNAGESSPLLFVLVRPKK